MIQALTVLEETAVIMPSYPTLQRAVELTRFDPDTRPVDVNNLLDIVLAGKYTLTNDENRFLFYDSRTNEPEETVFFIFLSGNFYFSLIKIKIFILNIKIL